MITYLLDPHRSHSQGDIPRVRERLVAVPMHTSPFRSSRRRVALWRCSVDRRACTRCASFSPGFGAAVDIEVGEVYADLRALRGRWCLAWPLDRPDQHFFSQPGMAHAMSHREGHEAT